VTSSNMAAVSRDDETTGATSVDDQASAGSSLRATDNWVKVMVGIRGAGSRIKGSRQARSQKSLTIIPHPNTVIAVYRGFFRTMLYISAAYAVMRCLFVCPSVCRIRAFYLKE